MQRVGAALADLLGERSQNNSYVKHIFSIWLYASAAQRQVMSVLSRLGFCSSYSSVAGLGDDLPKDPSATANAHTERVSTTTTSPNSPDNPDKTPSREEPEVDSDLEWLDGEDPGPNACGPQRPGHGNRGRDASTSRIAPTGPSCEAESSATDVSAIAANGEDSPTPAGPQAEVNGDSGWYLLGCNAGRKV